MKKQVTGLLDLLRNTEYHDPARFDYCVYCGYQLTGFGDESVGTVRFIGVIRMLRSHRSCWKKYGLGEGYNGSSDT